MFEKERIATPTNEEETKKKVKEAIIVFNDGSTITVNKFLGVFLQGGEVGKVDIVINHVNTVELLASMSDLNEHVHKLLFSSIDPVGMLKKIFENV